MGDVLGIVAIALMVIVLIIAIGSLFLAGTLPIARLVERRRGRHSD